MIEQYGNRLFQDPTAERNAYLIVLLTVLISAVTAYGWLRLFIDQGGYTYAVLQYNFLREIVFTLLSLLGAYLLYRAKPAGWVLLTGLLALAVLTSLRTLLLIGLSAAGYDIVGFGLLEEFTGIAITVLFWMAVSAIPLYLLLRRDLRSELGIEPGTVRLTLGFVLAVALLEIGLFFGGSSLL